MDQRGLGQCGKRLVKAVDHDIRTQLHGGFGEERMHSEMRSVCLIHDQGNSVPVRGFSNPGHIGYHPVVGRGSQEDGTDLFRTPEGPLHLLRADAAVYITRNCHV